MGLGNDSGRIDRVEGAISTRFIHALGDHRRDVELAVKVRELLPRALYLLGHDRRPQPVWI